MSEVTTKFPQLPKGGTDHYLLEKSVKNLKFNFEIQLYSESDTINDPQKILIFINAQKVCYAIPLFRIPIDPFVEFKLGYEKYADQEAEQGISMMENSVKKSKIPDANILLANIYTAQKIIQEQNNYC